MMETATWAGIGALILVNIVGWLFSYIRYTRNEGKAIGRMEGKVDALCSEVGELKKGMADLNGRCGRMEGRLNGMTLAAKRMPKRDSPRRQE